MINILQEYIQIDTSSHQNTDACLGFLKKVIANRFSADKRNAQFGVFGSGVATGASIANRTNWDSQFPINIDQHAVDKCSL